MNFDFHTHSTYSDGHLLKSMASRADKLGLKKLGIADHCNVSERDEVRLQNIELGFNLDQTYKRRKEALKSLNKDFEVELLDAVEMDYHPKDEEEITHFLEKAKFQYAIGSVHRIENVNVQVEPYFKSFSKSKRRSIVEKYFERQRKLVESEIFDIVSHIDLIERNKHLRGLAAEQDYMKVIEALKNSKTIPEVNAGRINRGLKEFHPTPEFLELFREENISFTIGTDSHSPRELEERTPQLRDKIKEEGLQVTTPKIRDFKPR